MAESSLGEMEGGNLPSPALSRNASSDLPTRNRKANGVGVQVGEEVQICVVMVGLPARGKSLIAQKGIPPRL